VDLNPTFMGRDFTVEYQDPFDQASARFLSHYGRGRALQGGAWVNRPPVSRGPGPAGLRCGGIPAPSARSADKLPRAVRVRVAFFCAQCPESRAQR
jgi:hypothetical protein